MNGLLTELRKQGIVAVGGVIISAIIAIVVAGWTAGQRIIDNIPVPKNAVLAFDGECPTGWIDVGVSDRVRFAGRTLIVAGPTISAIERNGSGGTSARDYGNANSEGGEETVTLTEAQMPRHNHQTLEAGDATNSQEVGGDSIPVARHGASWEAGKWASKTYKAGEDKPHNNMPPFIALHFCKRMTGG
jgi:hypothetical protein